jgi:hypothetical protein
MARFIQCNPPQPPVRARRQWGTGVTFEFGK